MTGWRGRVAGAVGGAEAHPVAADVALAAAVTAVAGLLRLVRLGEIPYGVNPDEAQIGLDAIRIRHEGWIGVYSHAALGIPTLNDYITAPGVWALGRTAFALRLDLALVGLAAVPLTYALVRAATGRAEAAFASLLLAVSYWHLLYSRVAHMSISYPTLLLAALLCIVLGLKRRANPQMTQLDTDVLGDPTASPGHGDVAADPPVVLMGAGPASAGPRPGPWAERAWFAGAGVFLGLCIYAYNVGAVAIAAAMVLLVALTVTRYWSRAAFARWWPSPAICAGVALVVALPFLWYISDPDAYFWEHIRTYRDVGVTRTAEYRDADLTGKARIIAEQVRTFAGTYAWDGVPDIVDANGQRPVFDPVTLALLAGGVALAWRRRRETMTIAAACCIVVLPLPAVLQQGSMMREPLGAAPSVAYIAALPLAAAWRWGWARRRERVALAWAACAAAVAPVLAVGTLTVRDYFGSWRDAELTRFVYHEEMTAASAYMKTLPPDTYVLFYSERHPLSLETRVYLAPDVKGVDRSSEFSGAGGSIALPARGGRVAFVLLGAYLPLLPEIEGRYPGGVEHTGVRGGRVVFAAYVVEGQASVVGRRWPVGRLTSHQQPTTDGQRAAQGKMPRTCVASTTRRMASM